MVTEITTESKICSLAFTPDGKHIVGGDETGGIRCWKLGGDLHQVGPTMMATGQVTTISVSNDALWIVSGDWGGKVTVWNASTHQKSLEIAECHHWVWAVDVTSDSTRIAAGSGDNSARIFNIVTGTQLIRPLKHDYTVTGLKFSPSNDQIATVTFDRSSVRIYNSHTGDKLFDIPVRVRIYAVTPLVWSSDGHKMFVASPGKITCFDTSSSALSEWSIHHKDPQVSIVTNGKFLACSARTSVSFWDAASRKQIHRTLGHAAPIQCIALCSETGYLACGNDKKLSVHNLNETLPTPYLVLPASRYPHPLVKINLASIDSWKQNDLHHTEAILSRETDQPNSNHHTLAHRSLIRGRLKQWEPALKDANSSLQVKPSPIGHIAKALALLGAGEKNLALSEFDFAFHVCEQDEVKFLLVVKSIFIFVSDSHEDAIFRISGLIPNADTDGKYYYVQVLASMYLQKGDYGAAIRSLKDAPRITSADANPYLMTISLIFGWNFRGIETIAWTRLCETFYASGQIKEVGETLLKMVDSLTGEEREAAYCRILERMVTRSGDVALLSWTGQSSAYNSCLPASPGVYTQTLSTPLILEEAEMESKIAQLRTSFPEIDALIIYDWITRLQPVRFTNRHLHLPCLPFRVQTLSKDEKNTYRAMVTWLGVVEFTTSDVLPLNAPRRLVFVHPWILGLTGAARNKVTCEDESESDVDVTSNSESGSGSGNEGNLDVDPSVVKEASPALDKYTLALQLIVRLGQPFNALLLMKHPDGTYKRVAAESAIVIPGFGCDVPKDIRPEVLEVV